MEEIGHSRQLFAARFRGRSNKIDKKGLSFALDNPSSSSILVDTPGHNPKKLVSLGTKAELIRNQLAKPKQLYPDNRNANPESRRPSPKLPKINTNQELSSIEKIDNSPVRRGRQAMPPSRSISDITPGMHKRHFGKYLQLNEEGLRHFQLLLQLEQRARIQAQLSNSHMQS